MINIYIGAALIIVYLLSLKKDPVAEAKKQQFGKAWEHLNYWNFGMSPAGGLLATTRKQALNNALITGVTSSHKSSAVLISTLQTLARRKSSVIVLDVKGELHKLTSGYMASRKKRKIYCLDFSDTSDGINPIDLCKDISDLDRLANVLIRNSSVTSKGDPFWGISSQLALSTFLQYVFFYAKPEERHMANVVSIIESYMSEPEKVDRLFLNTSEKILKSYRVLNATPEKTRQSILITLVAATRLFKSPAIARCTSMSTFSIEDFRRESSILYLCIPLNQINFLAPLTALICELTFQQILSRIPESNELPIFVCLDEMHTMSIDPTFFAVCRQFKSACIALIQDEGMLGLKYSEAEICTIKSNARVRVYLPGGISLKTCKELQEVIGKVTVENEFGSEKQIYAMEASDIRQCPKAIVFINAAKPFLLKVRPYFSHWIYNARTKFPQHEQERKIPYDEPPLTPFDDGKEE